MSVLGKMASNFGAFATSPIGLTLVVAFFLTVFTIVLLIKKMNQKVRIKRNYQGGEILKEISTALHDAATKNPHGNMRVRTINKDIIKMVAVDCHLPSLPKIYRVLEIEVRPQLNAPIIIRQGSACQRTNRLAPGQLAALCEAVKNYDPVEAFR